MFMSTKKHEKHILALAGKEKCITQTIESGLKKAEFVRSENFEKVMKKSFHENRIDKPPNFISCEQKRKTE